MKNLINNVFENIIGLASIIYKSIDKGNFLSFSEIKKNSVIISYTNEEIFGFNLRTDSNIPFNNQVGEFVLEKLKDYKSYLLLNIIKNNEYNKIYLYVNNSELAEVLEGILNIPKMTGDEIVLSFSDYFYYSRYKIELNTILNTEEKTILNIGKDNLLFHNIAEIALHNLVKDKKYNFYQLTSYKNNTINNISDLFSIKWEGILSLIITNNMSLKESYLNNKYEYNRKVDDELNKVYSVIVKDSNLKMELFEDNVLINGIFVGNNSSLGSISDKIGLNFIVNNYNGIDIYKNTLLKKSNKNFSFFIPKNNISYLINTTLKNIYKPYFIDNENWDIPDVYGKDYTSSFINYQFKQNTNPHVLIVGETGSGKTTAVLNIVHKALLFNDEFKSDFLEKDMVSLRYFDIDYSAGGLIKKIKENYPDKVLVKTKLQDIKFNLIDIETDDNGRIDEIQKNIILTFVDMILELIKTQTLSASERNILQKAIFHLYSKEYQKPDYTLGELLEYDNNAYKKLIEELYNKGYDKYTKISELPDEYNYLKKPTLKNLIDYLEKELGNINLNEIQKNAIIGLKDKLSSLANLKIFEFLPNINMKENKNICYHDLSEFRKNKELFVSIMWLLLMNYITKDKKEMFERLKNGKSKKKIIYVMEEAHNFLKISALKEIFSDFLKELRKYNIYLFFLIHRLSDIDETMYKSIATKFFLFKKGSVFTVKKEIEMFDKLNNEREIVFNKVKDLDRGIFVIHSNGADAIRFEISEKVLKHLKQEII